MNIAVLGTGDVGKSLALGFARAGHTVSIAGRRPENAEIAAWIAGGEHAASIEYRDFTSAASSCELAVLCVSGAHAITVAETVRTGLTGKILIDVTNPLEFPADAPMRLSVANDDSLGERVQHTLPETSVVKTLNTVNSHVMTHPGELGDDHAVFVAGNDESDRLHVREILEKDFGWTTVIDLGNLSAARATESYMHLWLHLWAYTGHAQFNIAVIT